MNLDTAAYLLGFLNDDDKLNTIIASPKHFDALLASPKLTKKFILKINSKNFELISKNDKFFHPLIWNLSVNFSNIQNEPELLRMLNRVPNLTKLELKNLKIDKFDEIYANLFENLSNLRNLKLNNCSIISMDLEPLNPLKSLKSLTFNECNENFYKIFTNQNSCTKIIIISQKWSWNGFSHEIFNKICKNCQNLVHLVLLGAGTGSYFDSEEFPFKITKLETSMLTFHWYEGILAPRVEFLKDQMGNLKELTIHELPYDCDGGKVIKFIIENMNLDNFYYGKIPLILNGKKQKMIKKFSANEIQISSALELMKQFSCQKFILKISSIDISSDMIEKFIKESQNLLNFIELEVIDNGMNRGTIGVFLDFFKKSVNVQKLILNSTDRNLAIILEECLPKMEKLKEIHLTSKAEVRILKAIWKSSLSLQTLSLLEGNLNEARKIFNGSNVIINLI